MIELIDVHEEICEQELDIVGHGTFVSVNVLPVVRDHRCWIHYYIICNDNNNNISLTTRRLNRRSRIQRAHQKNTQQHCPIASVCRCPGRTFREISSVLR